MEVCMCEYVRKHVRKSARGVKVGKSTSKVGRHRGQPSSTQRQRRVEPRRQRSIIVCSTVKQLERLNYRDLAAPRWAPYTDGTQPVALATGCSWSGSRRPKILVVMPGCGDHQETPQVHAVFTFCTAAHQVLLMHAMQCINLHIKGLAR